MTTELVELADRPEFTVDEALRIADQNADSYEKVASVSRTLAAEVRRLRALASRAGVPDGFVLVPRDATFDMEDAGLRWLTGFQHMRKQDRRNAMANAYAAMLAAAPEPVGVG